jgi:chemotaxis protein MotB
MAKRIIREDTVSHERWMVSYADFLTLLLAFFVVMYAVSQRNEDKFRVLSQTLSEAFNMPERSIDPIQVGEPVTASNPGNVPDAIESPEQLPGSGRVDEDEPKATTSEPQLPEEFRRISQRVEEQFADLVARDLVSVQGNEEWLEIELKSSLLFASGEATASEAARPIMREMAAVVRDSELPIRVEGFTDDRPIATSIYPSNWELSSARAATIVKLLTESGVGPTRLAAIGYGEFQPVAGNDSEEGRAANRRVVLMLSRNARLRPELPRTPLPAPGSAAALPATATPAATSEAGQPAAGPAEVTTGPGVPAPDATPAAPAEPGVVRVELEGGGILFTNDPARGAGTGATTSAAEGESADSAADAPQRP